MTESLTASARTRREMRGRALVLAGALALALFSGSRCSRRPERAEEENEGRSEERTGPELEYRGYPAVEISNGLVRMVVYVPDPEGGYYRGARFDWSGLVALAEFEGHAFFGDFRTPHKPTGNDHVTGPAEEFGMEAPVGYDEAGVGGTFVKIGVGRLRKAKDAPYRFYKGYELTDPGTWRTAHGDDWVEFRHELRREPGDPAGWSYVYTKRIALAAGAPSFVISHRLRNTGTRPIRTSHYCHNFVTVDGVPAGPGYLVRFTFEPEVESRMDYAEARGRELVFVKDIPRGKAYFAELAGFAPGPGGRRRNAAEVECSKAGAGLRIAGDRPVVKYNVYAQGPAVCPEPFVEIECAPGGEARWDTRYTFYLLGEEEGVHQWRYVPAEAGDYSVAVRVVGSLGSPGGGGRGGGWDKVKPAATGFLVTEPLVEFSDPNLKEDLLRRAAETANGRYPFIFMTSEGYFGLAEREEKNLRESLERGGLPSPRP